MRKIICLFIALVLCLSMAFTVFAAENDFVPSITYKPNPGIISVEGDDGQSYIGTIRDAENNIIDYVEHGCLMITPIAHVWDEDISVPVDVEDLLTRVYNALKDGSMVIPYEKHEAGLNPADMVIRDLFDIRWVCAEHAAVLSEDGVVFEITFDLGMSADSEVYAMVYDEETNEWTPTIKTVNNGDGTVTCTFKGLGVVEFSTILEAAGSGSASAADSGKAPNVMPWVAVLVLAAGGAAVVLSKSKKRAA